MDRTFITIAGPIVGTAVMIGLLAIVVHCAMRATPWIRRIPWLLRYQLQTLRFTQVRYEVHRSCSRPGRKADGYRPVVVRRGKRSTVRLVQTHRYW